MFWTQFPAIVENIWFCYRRRVKSQENHVYFWWNAIRCWLWENVIFAKFLFFHLSLHRHCGIRAAPRTRSRFWESFQFFKWLYLKEIFTLMAKKKLSCRIQCKMKPTLSKSFIDCWRRIINHPRWWCGVTPDRVFVPISLWFSLSRLKHRTKSLYAMLLRTHDNCFLSWIYAKKKKCQ